MPKHLLSNPDRAELSEQKYRTYEAIFLELLDTYPAPLKVKPLAGGALTTLVTRLREAANAVLANSHKFTSPILINVEELRALWPKVNVSIRGDLVVIAEPSALADVSRAQVEANTSPKSFVTISNPLLEELAAFASVVARHGCSDPFLFVGEVPQFTAPPGVAFEQTSEGWMML